MGVVPKVTARFPLTLCKASGHRRAGILRFGVIVTDERGGGDFSDYNPRAQLYDVRYVFARVFPLHTYEKA